jgi:Chitobiase/beta-hexosaminidase C-terminal domain
VINLPDPKAITIVTVKKMKAKVIKRIPVVVILCGLVAQFICAQTFQLASPRWEMLPLYDTFFTDSTEIRVLFDLPGATVHYTVDGTIPTEKSPVCRGTVRVKQSAVITLVAVHSDFRTSNPVSTRVIKIPSTYTPVGAGLQTRQSEKYRALSSISLVDGEKGNPADLHRHWLGFEGDSCVADLYYREEVAPDTLLVSALSNTAAWIFPPRRIEIWAWSEEKQIFVEVAGTSFPELAAPAPSENQILFLKNNTFKSKRWRAVVLPYGPIPDWHPGKGAKAWLFVDEIRFY